MKQYNFTTVNGHLVAQKLATNGSAPLFIPTSRGWKVGETLLLTHGQHGNPTVIAKVEITDEMVWPCSKEKNGQNLHVKVVGQ
jgi:hypothetical protein